MLEAGIINLGMVWAVLCGIILCLPHIPIAAQCPQAEKLIKAAVVLLHQELDFCLLKWRHVYNFGGAFGLDNRVCFSSVFHMNYTPQAKQRALTCSKAW